MSEPRVDIVLDTSAVLAYVEGDLNVGETIAEADSEGALTVVPAVCLASASAQGADMALLETRTRNPHVAVVTDEPAEWQALAAIHGMVPELAQASAMLATIDYGSSLLTHRPEIYEHLQGGGPVIAF